MNEKPADVIPQSETEILEALDFNTTRLCEHTNHKIRGMSHKDGDEYYTHLNYTCQCGTTNKIIVYCGAWLTHAANVGTVCCRHCHGRFPFRETIAILRPANEGTRK